MSDKKVYLLFTDTGTYLSRAINLYTRESLNHVSIAMDEKLDEVYSFGRKKPLNPFIGGFVKENMNNIMFADANCKIYELRVNEVAYNNLKSKFSRLNEEADKYRYNFVGLMTLAAGIEWERKDAYFCSQFAAKTLEEAGVTEFDKHHSLIRPGELRKIQGLRLLYEGKVSGYKNKVGFDSRVLQIEKGFS